MKLQLCPSIVNGSCTVDDGWYSGYAGPVKFESSDAGFQPDCSLVTALMWQDDVAIIDRQLHVAACD